MLDAKVLIMDEPTSSLTNKEVDYLFLIMNQLRKEAPPLFISPQAGGNTPHLRPLYGDDEDGSSVCSGMVSDVSNDDVKLMVGRELQNRFNAMKETPATLSRTRCLK
jgi:D-allose transport system ATP-binding protein